MLKQRVFTALILVPLVLIGIYYADERLLGLVVLAGILACGWEWLKLVPVVRPLNQCLAMVSLMLALWLCTDLYAGWLLVGIGFWGVVLVALLTYPASQRWWGYPAVVWAVGLLLLPLLANTIVELYHEVQGQDLIVYVFCLVWASDIGAYFAGKQWGRHKLIPQVSPGKTWEGLAGGFLLAMLVACLGVFHFKPVSAIGWFVIAAGVSLISVVGDLLISLLKRRSQVKDTGALLPGHGGVLDRLDSLIAAMPCFYWGWNWMLSGI